MQCVVWVLVHIGGWGLIVLAAGGLGHFFLRKLHFDSVLERLVFTAAFGLGVWALVFFALGLVGVLYREVILALTAIGAFASLFYITGSYRSPRLSDFSRWKRCLRLRRLITVGVIIVALGYWALLLQLPEYPPIAWDSTAYHLVLAREYVTQHRVVPHEGITLPVVPALNHMLFAWALSVQDDILAQFIEHTLMMLTALALYAWGKRRNNRALGLAAAAFWLGQPLVLWLGESAYVDVGNACYAFLGVYALRVFWEGRDSRWWYLAVMLLGMAAGIKMSGLFVLAVATAFGLWALVRSTLTLKALLRGCAIAIAIASPWYAFIAHHTGNPFWPAVAPLSTEMWRPSADFVWRAFGNVGVPKTLLNFVLLPIHITLSPELFLPDNGRHLLPIIIAFPLAWIIALWHRSVRWWTFWALAYTAFWFLTSQQLRFWMPAVPLVGLALYESIEWMLERAWRSPPFHAAVWSVIALFALYVCGRSSMAVIAAKRWPPPFTHEAREMFLANSLVGYRGVQYINKRAKEGEAIYAMNGSWLNYYFKPRVIDANGLLQLTLRPTFLWPGDEPWVRWLESRNVEWIFMNRANVPFTVPIPKQNPVLRPFWPDYEIVYSDSTTWVLRHKPIPPEDH